MDESLDYARGAVFGPIVLDRREDCTTITLRSSTGLLVEAIALAFVSLLLALPLVIRMTIGGRSSAMYLPDAQVISAVFSAMMVIASLAQIRPAFHSRTIEFVPSRNLFAFSLRKQRELKRFKLPRSWIVEAEVIRQSGLRRLFRPLRVAQVVMLTGDRIHLHYGTAAECDFLVGLLIEELKLPKDTWVEAGFPKPRPLSRLSVRIDPTGFLIRQRPRIAWWLIASSVSLLPLTALLFIAHDLAQHRTLERMIVDGSLPGGVVIGLCLSLGAIGLAVQYFRRATLKLNARRLELSEQSPFRPVLNEWPISEIAGFDSFPKSKRKIESLVRLIDGESAVLLSGLSDHDAIILDQCLRLSLFRAKEAAEKAKQSSGKGGLEMTALS